MTLRRTDWVALIEASYSLEGSDRQWLDGLFDCAEPLLDRGMGCAAWTFRCTPATFRLGELSTRGSTFSKAVCRAGHALAPDKWFDLTYRMGHAVGTASQLIYPHLPYRNGIFQRLTADRSTDLFMTGGVSATGLGVAFGVLLRSQRNATAMERKRWQQISAHLGAGLRLRAATRNLVMESPGVEAVLDSGGTMHHGREDATANPARENLREAVRCIERARANAGRLDPDAAMDRWEALVSGRWSLVDRFDTDGKRFVVAIKNDPAHPDPRGLTPRERQVAELVGLGRSTKEIGYTLGISNAAVTNCTARAEEKLGLSSRTELVNFFAQYGLRRKLAEVAVCGERLLIGAYPLIDEQRVSGLTEAERDVVAHLIAGSTNADIAARRCSSEYTVANQLQSIFRKLEVRSRNELAVKLQAQKS